MNLDRMVGLSILLGLLAWLGYFASVQAQHRTGVRNPYTGSGVRSYNPYTGRVGTKSGVYNSYTGRRVSGRASYRGMTGASGTRRAANPYTGRQIGAPRR